MRQKNISLKRNEYNRLFELNSDASRAIKSAKRLELRYNTKSTNETHFRCLVDKKILDDQIEVFYDMPVNLAKPDLQTSDIVINCFINLYERHPLQELARPGSCIVFEPVQSPAYDLITVNEIYYTIITKTEKSIRSLFTYQVCSPNTINQIIMFEQTDKKVIDVNNKL